MAEPRVLVVDDDEAVRALVGSSLARTGIDVTVAADGSEALRTVASTSFDLVVLDWHMPGLSGLEVLEALRRDHPRQQVMVCTGAGTADRNLALAAGAIDFFTKDRPVADFVRRVRAILAGDFEPVEPDDDRAVGAAADGLRAELGRIAHELHNHLTVVLGHTDLARSQLERAAVGVDERVLEDLDAVTAAAERIGELSRGLRDLAEGEGVDAAPPPDDAGPPAVVARILLLEDDRDLRTTVGRLLEAEGFDVRSAADVDSALALLDADGDVDLCLADLLIPGAAPGEAAARLAAATPGTPLVVMSGHGEDAVSGSQAPPTARFLAKPFTRDRLLDGIRGALTS